MQPVKVFCCYAHEDEAFRAELAAHIARLKHQQVIQDWHDRNISAELEWADQVDSHLASADVVLLLVSPDFMASDYCYDEEMACALKRHEQGLAIVVPIMLKPTDLQDSPLMHLQSLPLALKPLSLWPDRGQAYADVVRGLHRLIVSLHKKQNAVPPQPPFATPQGQPTPKTAASPSVNPPLGRSEQGHDEHRGKGLNAQGLPDIVWCQIPEGDVVLADHAGQFHVQPFYLARYPITNAQFQSFIDTEDGYRNPRWWEGLATAVQSPKPPHWPEADHPRESVSWFEAMAFCAWLSEQLGYAISLPSEWQWQQAACSGQAAWEYPWGMAYQTGHANIDETWGDIGPHYLGKTTPVGAYPQGDSLQGVADLIGNVWEWCLNTYDPPENRAPQGAAPRVLRGGSWFNFQGSARVPFRVPYGPGGCGFDFGFRVCCVSPV